MDPEDPTVIAETELLGAAASIEAAAKKLEQLKPRAKPRVSIKFVVLLVVAFSQLSPCLDIMLLSQLFAAPLSDNLQMSVTCPFSCYTFINCIM